tara:strand:- start:174 stop:422 length:249 start_codon:yes stop_codon:yes gene_type:complete
MVLSGIDTIEKYMNIEKRHIVNASNTEIHKFPNTNWLLLKGANAILRSTFLCTLKSKISLYMIGYNPKEPIMKINPGKTQIS